MNTLHESVKRQMCWLSPNPRSPDGEKILMLRESSRDRWIPYYLFPKYAIPDRHIPGIQVSPGHDTYLKLRDEGWELVSSKNHKFDLIPLLRTSPYVH